MNKEYPCKGCLIIILCRIFCPEVIEMRKYITFRPVGNICCYCGNKLCLEELSKLEGRLRCDMCNATFSLVQSSTSEGFELR